MRKSTIFFIYVCRCLDFQRRRISYRNPQKNIQYPLYIEKNPSSTISAFIRRRKMNAKKERMEHVVPEAFHELQDAQTSPLSKSRQFQRLSAECMKIILSYFSHISKEEVESGETASHQNTRRKASERTVSHKILVGPKKKKKPTGSLLSTRHKTESSGVGSSSRWRNHEELLFRMLYIKNYFVRRFLRNACLPNFGKACDLTSLAYVCII